MNIVFLFSETGTVMGNTDIQLYQDNAYCNSSVRRHMLTGRYPHQIEACLSSATQVSHADYETVAYLSLTDFSAFPIDANLPRCRPPRNPIRTLLNVDQRTHKI